MLTKKQLEQYAFEYLWDYYKEHNYLNIQTEDTFVVWYNYTLGNMKILMSTNIDNNYFEFTYHCKKADIYVDVYTHNRKDVLHV